ncbi:MAG: SDR family oxidoreductase [Gammaproteobacteria bacterium]|nr:SDR family oxidoreductase [Gammaproteobacteria bacterium]
MSQGAPYPDGAALVLGGSGGLGAACARRIAADANNVALSYHANRAAADALQQDIAERHGVVCTAHQLDVSDRDACQALVENVIEQHGRINTLVYAVGSNISQPTVAEMSAQQWSDVIDHDLHGFVHAVQPVIAHMREQGGGSIVHVSSAGLGKTPPRDGLSVAPKAAIDALLKTIATEEGAHGIRANSVGVGVIEAGIFKRLEAQGVFDEDWKTAVKAALPLGRFGKAEDIAEAVNFLASARANYVTGQRLFVDGGYNA